MKIIAMDLIKGMDTEMEKINAEEETDLANGKKILNNGNRINLGNWPYTLIKMKANSQTLLIKTQI